ncbi:MAG: molybdopterin cofactor-binding domain-containing protein, partial [Thermoanaerobaculia bacterium]
MSWRDELNQEVLRQQMGGPTTERGVSITKDGGLDRRDFLKVTGGLVIFVALGPTGTPAVAQRRRPSYPDDFNAYLRIGEDGRVTVFSGKIEMGQGTMTSLAQMAAEDLGVSLEKIDMVMGDTDLCPWDMGTWGSLSTRMFGPALRTAAAKAREVLIDLAAERLEVPASQLGVDDGTVFVTSDRKRSISYAELAGGEPIAHTVDREAVLKTAREFSTMGVPTKRLDARAKVRGKAEYAGDIRLPGMLYARVLRPPAHGSDLRSVDTKKAEQVPGALILRDDDLVAALHEDPEQAEKAVDLIEADWNVPAPQMDETTIWEYLESKDPGGTPQDVRGSMEAGAEHSTKRFTHTFRDGYVAHAPIETHTATAH